MDIHEFCCIGKRLFGARWKTPLAKAIGVTRETISRCAAGKQRISPLVANAVQLLDQQRPRRYHEWRYKTNSEMITQIGEAQLINADCRSVKGFPPVDAILTDPVWPAALAELPGSYNPEHLFAEAMACITPALKPDGCIIVQLRCDSDPRILRGIPPALSLHSCSLVALCRAQPAGTYPYFGGRRLYLRPNS